jgi:MFS family permease
MKKRVGSVARADHPIVQKKIDESLKLSIKEGSLASVSSGFGFSYLSPFALLLNATSSQIGILHAIVSLLPSLVQLRAAKLIERFSRKQIVLKSILWQTLIWIPIILTGLLFYLGVPHVVWILIVFIALFHALGAIAGPVWFSWMGSLVPEKERGRYFSRRNRISGFYGLITMIVGALLLDGAKFTGGYMGNVLGFTLLGFGLLFSLSAIARFWSWVLFYRQYEPKLHVRKRDYFSFWQFLKKAPFTPFGKFTIFRGFFTLAISIAGPFWAVYMLRDLGFSYMWFMGITVSSIIFQLIALPVLGKFSDRFGNVKLMRTSCWLIFAGGALWLAPLVISGDLTLKLYLLLVPSMISGFGWAGYNLAVNNYIYDAVAQQKRSFGSSYMNIIVGIGAFIGAGLGSFIALFEISFINPLLFIFAISAVARLLVATIGLRFLKEVRHVGKFSSNFLVKEFRPMQGVVREVHHLEHLVKKVEHHI